MKQLLICFMLVILCACPNGQPPPYFPIGTNDGNGGAFYNLGIDDPLRKVCMPVSDMPGKGPNDFWCPPSTLRGHYMTTAEGQAALVKWAYDCK